MKRTKAISGLLSLISLGMVSPAFAQDAVTVAYFQEWPMPFQYAKAKGLYEERLGVPVNWVAFDSGTAMSAAMAAGDVQIAISQGVPPFVVAVSAGQDLEVVDIAASYSDNDNCVVASRLEIDKDSAGELAGKRVALPVGTIAHYGFLQQMEHFGVDPASMTIVDMAPAEAAAAFGQGSIDMACGWGGALDRMKAEGNVLLSGEEKEEAGILAFDLTTTSARFAAENPKLLADFLAVTEDANAMWNAGDKRDEMLPVIAQDAGMDEASAAAVIDNFKFLSPEEQLSETWLGGRVASYFSGVATMFHELGNLPSALPSYAEFIDTSALSDVSGR
ncbi:taurine ABC transporter substrate-binding protein [Paracoccus seriniphilus]|uniref:taurine ABC transporter substrate-binding protein n=1 Tax=Paracoccus seriniphilus TaxID=184748 RepID=UPI00356396AE